MSDIKNKLKFKRKEKNLSYADLSRLTGISKSTLQRYETGTTEKISLVAVKKIADALKVSQEYLMGWDNKPSPNNELQHYLEQLHKRPEMRMLFSLTSKATKEDVEKSVAIVEAFLGKKNA